MSPAATDGDGRAPAFRRILLKLSGEALMGPLEYGADRDRIAAIAAQVKRVADRGVEIAVVVGGGNIYRGLRGAAEGMDRATGDYMGMLATVLNALALQDALEKLGAVTRVQSAIEVSEVAEPYIRRRAMRHLDAALGHAFDGMRNRGDALRVRAVLEVAHQRLAGELQQDAREDGRARDDLDRRLLRADAHCSA